MKKKLALLMAAIMTVAMVPMTAFASTKLTAVDEISTAVEKDFVSVVELVKNDDQVDIDETKYPDNLCNAIHYDSPPHNRSSDVLIRSDIPPLTLRSAFHRR